jgi:acyl-CoA reductase-like NAD-dependent aldehyde dehydrogenase
MKIVQEEIFGLLATVKPFETEEEAVSVTNESKYNFVSYVCTQDHKKGLRMIHKIDTRCGLLEQLPALPGNAVW